MIAATQFHEPDSRRHLMFQTSTAHVSVGPPPLFGTMGAPQCLKLHESERQNRESNRHRNPMPLTCLGIGDRSTSRCDYLQGKDLGFFRQSIRRLYKDQKSRPFFRVQPEVVSTGNWRGYLATWTIENGFLHLVKIDSWICRDWDAKSCRKATLRGLFGSGYRDGKVKANWYSGRPSSARRKTASIRAYGLWICI